MLDAQEEEEVLISSPWSLEHSEDFWMMGKSSRSNTETEIDTET